MNVCVVTGICVRYDAISDCVVDQLRTLRAVPNVEALTLFTQGVDRDGSDLHGVRVVVGDDPWEMLRHDRLRAADLVILHWGIGYELFDAIVVLPTMRRTAVHFHNVTPVELLTGGDRDKAERSMHQVLALAASQAEVWTYSEYNRRTLRDLGVAPERSSHVPITIERPAGQRRELRRSDGVDVLTVGRAVPAKGLHIALEAFASLPPDLAPQITWTIAGNMALSDADYVRRLRRRIHELGLDARVTVHDRPTRATLWELYDRSHVVLSASFHEGLCVPIVEGYLAGCRAVGTTAGNLPYIVFRPDPIVPPGDPTALAVALADVCRDVSRGGRAPIQGAEIAASYSADAAQRALVERLAPPTRGARPVSEGHR